MNTIRRVSQNITTSVGIRKKDNNNDTGEMNEEILLQNVKDKVNIVVKSSPSKDARSISYISIKNGFASKRNEQGVWSKRYLCMVPHMFLYYYDSEQSEQPKGVVDLHLYTNFTIEGENDNILKISIDDNDNNNYRSFYFEFDDPNDVSAWITMVHRERYQTVRDERDAYQQLQDQFSGQIDTMSSTIESCNIERERLQKELAQAQIDQLNADEKVSKALASIQRTLAKFGMTDDSMSNTIDLDVATNMLTKAVSDMKERIDNQTNESDRERLLERTKYEEKIKAIEKQLALEQQARKNVESLLNSEKKEAEVRIRDALLETEKASLNMQMAVASKNASDEKALSLTEEKKILVKEVKQLRKKLETSNETIESLKALNDRLTISSLTLQQQQLQQQQQQVQPVVVSKPKEDVNVNLPDINQVIDNEQDDDEQDDSNGVHPSERCSWEMPASSLKQLGWLSPEQLNLIEGRSQMQANDIQPEVTTNKSKSFLSSMFQKDASSSSSSSNSVVGDLLGLNDVKGSSFNLNPSSYFENPLSENESSQPDGTIDKLICLKCDGTVAGPKYSTCKCAIPALTPDALSNNPSSSIFNLSFGGVVNAVKRSSAIMTEKLSSIGNDNKDWERTL